MNQQNLIQDARRRAVEPFRDASDLLAEEEPSDTEEKQSQQAEGSRVAGELANLAVAAPTVTEVEAAVDLLPEVVTRARPETEALVYRTLPEDGRINFLRRLSEIRESSVPRLDVGIVGSVDDLQVSVSLESSPVEIGEPEGVDLFMRLEIPDRAEYTVSIASADDLVAHIYAAAEPARVLATDDDSGGNLDPRIVQELDAGSYYLRIMPFSQEQPALSPFTVTLSQSNVIGDAR